MKFLNNIISDFRILPTKIKVVFFVLLVAIYSLYPSFNKLYINQSNSMNVLKTFIELPLPEYDRTELITGSHDKIKYYYIVFKVKDIDKIYEKKIKEYLVQEKYLNYGELYYSKDVILKIYRNHENLYVRIEGNEQL